MYFPILRLPCNARDPSKADVFIIPFDAGVHSYIDHKDGKPRLASPHGWRAISLLKHFSNNPVGVIPAIQVLF